MVIILEDIEELILKVLALFDEEDIEYIQSEIYKEYIKEIEKHNKKHVKKVGDTYDRRRTME